MSVVGQQRLHRGLRYVAPSLIGLLPQAGTCPPLDPPSLDLGEVRARGPVCRVMGVAQEVYDLQYEGRMLVFTMVLLYCYISV